MKVKQAFTPFGGPISSSNHPWLQDTNPYQCCLASRMLRTKGLGLKWFMPTPSEQREKPGVPTDSIQSWLLNDGILIWQAMAYEIIPIFNWVGFHPLLSNNQPGALFSVHQIFHGISWTEDLALRCAWKPGGRSKSLPSKHQLVGVSQDFSGADFFQGHQGVFGPSPQTHPISFPEFIIWHQPRQCIVYKGNPLKIHL